MSMATAEMIQESLMRHLSHEVECRLLEGDDGRIGCVTPLELPNRDNVVVWVRHREHDFEITDYGEALAEYAAYKGQERRNLTELVQAICRGQGVEYSGGRITTRASWETLGEFVWRVATAAAQAGQAAHTTRPRRRQREEREFAVEVERTFRQRQLPVEREYRLQGRSGHKHRATIFVPSTHTVVEPVTGHWNQVTATYAKLGDLQHANGFRLYALLDDRHEPPDEDVEGLLVQVSRVVTWSRRDEWISSVA
jgi:hypothetical protein